MDNGSDISWVKPFIHNLFCGDSKNAEQYMAEKMKYLNRPFYKYCYVCEELKRTAETIDYNILNFENDELFFQNPSLFNDPFDCYLGFSQIEMVRNLLVSIMRQQKKYTPQMRKAINCFFDSDSGDSFSVDELDKQTTSELVNLIMPIVISSEVQAGTEQPNVEKMLKKMTNESNIELFIKLLQNKLTVSDKQTIIDIMFDDPSFLESTKSQLENPQYSDFITNAVKHDMKLKVETTPDYFIGSDGENVFQTIDLFKNLINNSLDKEIAVELSEVKEQFNEASKSAMEKNRKLISEKCKITCLSEKMDSPLMWSHYANKHFGFCLEYDFTHSMIRGYPDFDMAKIMLLPVIYSDKRPLLSKAISQPKVMLQYMKTKKLPNAIVEDIIYGLLFKSQDWSYEREWRIIGIDMKKQTMKLPPARKLFLGANIEENAKDKLIEIARKKHIPVYQMFLSSDRYKFEYYKVE